VARRQKPVGRVTPLPKHPVKVGLGFKCLQVRGSHSRRSRGDGRNTGRLGPAAQAELSSPTSCGNTSPEAGPGSARVAWGAGCACDRFVFRTCVLEGLPTFDRYCMGSWQGDHATCMLHGAEAVTQALSKVSGDQRIRAPQVIGQAGRHTCMSLHPT
jgi:hypothetical protein